MSNSFKIRNFIKAKSEKGLRRLMFDKQIELNLAWLLWHLILLTRRVHGSLGIMKS